TSVGDSLESSRPRIWTPVATWRSDYSPPPWVGGTSYDQKPTTNQPTAALVGGHRCRSQQRNPKPYGWNVENGTPLERSPGCSRLRRVATVSEASSNRGKISSTLDEDGQMGG